MTTVSLVEIKTPVSLRTCGSSVSSLVHRRTRLQCFSPDKRAAAYKSRTPDLRGRTSISPKLFGLEGTQLVSSPADSPIPHPSVTPFGSRQSRFDCDEFSSSESLDEFSDDELGLDTDEENVDDKQKLFVLGSRQQLHGPYDVPNLKALESKRPSSVKDAFSKKHFEVNPDRDSDSSPENPPPSPINFRPSIDGFVVGGQKLVCPERSTTSPGINSNSRDFVPGFVKYPLYHCNKCEGRVVEEEQTEVALQRRRSCLLQSRLSTHRHQDDTIQSVGSRLGRDSQMLMSSLDPLSPGFMSPDPHGYYDKTFIEIYMEKKKQKEERDRELEEQKQRKRERRQTEERGKRKNKTTKRNERIGDTSRYLDRDTEVPHVKRSDELIVKSTEIVNKSSSNFEDSDSVLNKLKNTTDTTTEPSKQTSSTVISKSQKQRCRTPSLTSCRPKEIERLQIRRCWSDIWPFPGKVNFSRKSEEDFFSYDFDIFRNTSRITPFYPLLRPPGNNSSDSRHFSCESLTTNQSNHALSLEEDGGLKNITPIPDNVENSDCKPLTPMENDITMTATVIVPPRDTTCNQWISFSAENEPVLNNSPDIDDSCDTFLKRLQRTKVCNTDPSLPTGQQFCFEAVVDKRYNRWKRRRRRKKEGELRRAVRPLETDSSDENDDRNSEVEQILDRMYDQIHGPAPLTPNGSRDTPRLRNRRRRKEVHEKPVDLTMTSSDPTVTNYDASSEWTSSDKDSGHLSSNSGLGQCNEKVSSVTVRNSAERKNTDDPCYWPFIEQYKQEILKKIKNTPHDQLEAMDQKDWLPDITSQYNGRNSKASQRSEKEESVQDDYETKTSAEFISLRTRQRSDSISNKFTKDREKSVDKGLVTKDAKVSSNMYKKWSRSNQQPLRNTYPMTSQNTKLLSRTGATTWSEMGASQKSARQIGVVEVGQNCLDSTFKASLRPIKRDNEGLPGQAKQSKTPLKEQSKPKTTGLNLPALSKNIKSQTFPQNIRRDHSTKGKKKPQTPIAVKTVNTKRVFSRPKTQPSTGDKTFPADHMDPNLIFRDYYLKTLYNERSKVNSHVGPFITGKNLKKTITVDQLDLGGRKNRTDDDKLSDLAFTRSFTFSMFDLPEVYKLYNANLLQRANGEVVETTE